MDALRDAEFHFCTKQRPQFLDISQDKHTIRYKGSANHSNDVGAIRTNKPFPDDCFIGYYEIYIHPEASSTYVSLIGSTGPNLPLREANSVALGIADSYFSLCRHPGCEAK